MGASSSMTKDFDIIVGTDYRLLENIFKKRLNQWPVQLQRMRLVLQKHNLQGHAVTFQYGVELLFLSQLYTSSFSISACDPKGWYVSSGESFRK